MPTVEDTTRICKWLGINQAEVLSINLYVLPRQLEVKTIKTTLLYDLVENIDDDGNMVLVIVKDIYCPICGTKMSFAQGMKISAKYNCPEHGTFVVGFMSAFN